MQLAASQRAHPPPVPPRPSRQVVAEALKKSPRPPCPTRQAPPPPNQRPWRQEEQQDKPESNGSSGRTIVYDSAHLAKAPEAQPRKLLAEDKKSSEDQSHRSSIDKDERKRPVSRDFSNGKDHHKDLEQPKIDDTSRKKDKENNTLMINNNSISNSSNSVNNSNSCNDSYSSNNSDSCNDNNNSDKDQCDGPSISLKEVKIEGSAERKKKKGHNVTFKEEKIIVEATIEHHRRSPSPAKSIDNCATVVVIDDVEGGRPVSQEEHDNIKREDWLEAGVRYSSTKITLPAEDVVVVNGFSHPDEPQQQQQPKEEEEEEANRQQQQQTERGDAEEEEEEEEVEEAENQLEFGDLDFSSIIERIAMSSLQGLPPLPRSLSGFNLNGAGLVEPVAPPPPARSSSKASQRGPKTPSSTSLSSSGSRPSPSGRQLTTLDTQLAILRREMFGLRQLDLSLLSQLWSLNESIQEFRQLLQEQEDRAPSPSPSSEEGDDTSYSGGPTHPPPPPRRPAPTTPHHRPMHHHHHHRAARAAARSSKLPPSDESPSSEEYGAV